MAGVASPHDEQQPIAEEWTAQVEGRLRGEEAVDVSRATTRLPRALVDAKADVYIPQVVPLGPYHHHTLQDVSVGAYQRRLVHISEMEMYKLKFASEAAGGDAAVIGRVLTQVMEPPFIKKVEDFYNWNIAADATERRCLGVMMTVDALFLFQFLKDCMKERIDDDHCMPFVSCVRCDILKLENQIPLFLLLQVKEAVPAEPFDLQSRIKCLSTFEIRSVDTPDLEREEHLLGCMHKYVSSFLQIETAKKDAKPTSCWKRISSKMGAMVVAIGGMFGGKPGQDESLNRYNAEKIAKAGISFKPFPNDGAWKIRFDKKTRTLFLPKIEVVETLTEVMLRNLVALELKEPARLKAVTHYVELIKCLVDTPEDVSLLRHSGVIVRRSMTTSDEYVAEMWRGMCKPVLAEAMVMEPLPELKRQIEDVLIDNQFQSKIKTLWGEFRRQHLAKPWQVVALLVKTFLVVVVQYRLIDWNEKITITQRTVPSPLLPKGKKHFFP